MLIAFRRHWCLVPHPVVVVVSTHNLMDTPNQQTIEHPPSLTSPTRRDTHCCKASFTVFWVAVAPHNGTRYKNVLCTLVSS